MDKLTILEIKKLLFQNEKEISDNILKQLKKDDRKGVQSLLSSWYKQKEKLVILQQKYKEMQSYEKGLREKGIHLIAGIDEVGRGPLAGPVVAAAVVLPENTNLLGIDDSKKLTEDKREYYYKKIMDIAVSYGIGIISPPIIDKINIYQATIQAMEKAISELGMEPEHLLVDAVRLPILIPQTNIIKGDAKSISIAAASILAKVTRDHLMYELDKEYPNYGFAKNMGYGTKEHLNALQKYGPIKEHRFSFQPIKDSVIENSKVW